MRSVLRAVRHPQNDQFITLFADIHALHDHVGRSHHSSLVRPINDPFVAEARPPPEDLDRLPDLLDNAFRDAAILPGDERLDVFEI